MFSGKGRKQHEIFNITIYVCKLKTHEHKTLRVLQKHMQIKTFMLNTLK